MASLRLKTILTGGDDWLIARFEGADGVTLSAGLQQAAASLREAGGWLDIVPGLADLAVRIDTMSEAPDEAEKRLADSLSGLPPINTGGQETLDIPVCYGGDHGPDLARCAETLSLSEAEIIRLHTGEPFLVQMMGFAPGFAYCGETPEALAMERLAEPRRRVEAGSIGIVGRQTCLYSVPGPGGWPLIGRTPIRLFDVTSDTPFRLSAGMQVRFKAIDEAEFARLQEAG